jgi:hypothetical protein
VIDLTLALSRFVGEGRRWFKVFAVLPELSGPSLAHSDAIPIGEGQGEEIKP